MSSVMHNPYPWGPEFVLISTVSLKRAFSDAPRWLDEPTLTLRRYDAGASGRAFPRGPLVIPQNLLSWVVEIDHPFSLLVSAIMVEWMSTHQSSPSDWAATHFGGCWLGHKSRDRRLVSYATALAEQPGKLMPELFSKKYDIEATYSLLRHREATPDRIQATHRRLVKSELKTPGRFLLIEDTMFVSYTHRKKPVEGLGPIGDSEEGRQGFMLHSVLAVRAPLPAEPDATGRRPPVMILGLLDQQYLVRSPAPMRSRSRRYHGNEPNGIGSRIVGWSRAGGSGLRPQTQRRAGFGSPTVKQIYTSI